MSISIFDILAKAISDEEKKQLINDLIKIEPACLSETADRESSVLHEACRVSSVALISWLIEKKPELIETKTILGCNVLFVAARCGNEAAVSYFLNLNENKNVHLATALSNDGSNVLHYAAVHGNVNVMHLLLKFFYKQKAPDEKNEEKLTENFHLEWLSKDKTLFIADDLGNYPIHDAAENDKIAMVKYLITDCKVDINLKQTKRAKYTPFHIAVRNGFLELAKELKKISTEVDKPNDYGSHPIHMAAKSGSVEMIKYFLDECKIDIDLKEDNGKTPIQIAAEYNRKELVKELINRGANWQQPNLQGEFLLHIASKSNSLSVVRYLIEEKNVSKYSRMQGDNEYKSNRDTPLSSAISNGAIGVCIYLYHPLGLNKIVKSIKRQDKLADTVEKRNDLINCILANDQCPDETLNMLFAPETKFNIEFGQSREELLCFAQLQKDFMLLRRCQYFMIICLFKAAADLLPLVLTCKDYYNSGEYSQLPSAGICYILKFLLNKEMSTIKIQPRTIIEAMRPSKVQKNIVTMELSRPSTPYQYRTLFFSRVCKSLEAENKKIIDRATSDKLSPAWKGN